LPKIVVYTFFFLAAIVEALTLSLIGWPIRLITMTFTLVDVLWSNAFRFLIGSWFKPLAYVFIFPVKLVLMPFSLIGGLNNIIFAIITFPLTGWMLLFGNGCFLRWGPDCSTKRWGERAYYQKFTLPFWMRDPASLIPKIPEQGSFLDSLKNNFDELLF
jgi:hypothetical protein